jgi:hypothetical protein
MPPRLVERAVPWPNLKGAASMQPMIGNPSGVVRGVPAIPLPLHLAGVGAVVLASAFVLARGLYEPASSHTGIAIGCGLCVIALIAYTRYGLRLPWLSASVVYLVLFWMFHFGLTFTAAVAPTVLSPFEDWEVAWMYWPNVRLAMILGVIGAAGFVSGLVLTSRQPGTTQVVRPRDPDPVLYSVGWIVMMAGLGGALFALVAGGGLDILGLGYGEFRTGLLTIWFQTFVDLSQLGCVLALCGAGGNGWVKPLLAWAPLGVLMLLIGLRGQTLVPAAVFAIVLARRGVHFNRGALVAAVIAATVAIPMIRTVRNVGLANASQVDWRGTSPLETFTELGSTLRAVRAYVDWIEDGDEYLLGATYWAPFDRQVVAHLVPGRTSIPYEDDTRLPERLIELEGAIGLSATGEAYYNFGVPGPFLYFAFVGVIIGWLDRRASKSPYHAAALGIVAAVMYFNIRSHWLFVPAQVTLGLGAVAFCYLVGRVLRMRTARLAGPPYSLLPARTPHSQPF